MDLLSQYRLGLIILASLLLAGCDLIFGNTSTYRFQMTVEVETPDDLSATFGEGYELERITVQVTDDPVTTRMEKRLRWIEELENHNFFAHGLFYKKYLTIVQYLTSK